MAEDNKPQRPKEGQAEKLSSLKNINNSLRISVPEYLRSLKEGTKDFDSISKSLHSITKDIEIASKILRDIKTKNPIRQQELSTISNQIRNRQRSLSSEETQSLLGGYTKREEERRKADNKRKEDDLKNAENLARSSLKVAAIKGRASSSEEFHRMASAFPGEMSSLGIQVKNVDDLASHVKAKEAHIRLEKMKERLKEDFKLHQGDMTDEQKSKIHNLLTESEQTLASHGKSLTDFRESHVLQKTERRKQAQLEKEKRDLYKAKIMAGDIAARETPYYRANGSYGERVSHYRRLQKEYASVNDLSPSSISESSEKNKTLSNLMIQMGHIRKTTGLLGSLGTAIERVGARVLPVLSVLKVVGGLAYNGPNKISALYNGQLDKSSDAMSYILGTSELGRGVGSSGAAFRRKFSQSYMSSSYNNFYSPQDAKRMVGAFGQTAPMSYYSNLVNTMYWKNQNTGTWSGVPDDMMARSFGKMYLLGNRMSPSDTKTALTPYMNRLQGRGLNSRQSLAYIQHAYQSFVNPNMLTPNLSNFEDAVTSFSRYSPFYTTEAGRAMITSGLQRGSHFMSSNPAALQMMGSPGLFKGGRARLKALDRLYGKAKRGSREYRDRQNVENTPFINFLPFLESENNTHLKHFMTIAKKMASSYGGKDIGSQAMMLSRLEGVPYLTALEQIGNVQSSKVGVSPNSAYASEDYMGAKIGKATGESLSLIASFKDFDVVIKNIGGHAKDLTKAMEMWTHTIEIGSDKIAKILNLHAQSGAKPVSSPSLSRTVSNAPPPQRHQQ